MTTLMRLSPAWSSFPKWALKTVLLGTTVLGVLFTRSVDVSRNAEVLPDQVGDPHVIATVMWCVGLAYLVMPGCRQRCSRFFLSLPLAPRRVWLAHTIVVVATAGLIQLALTGLLVAGNRLSLQWLGVPFLPGSGAAKLALHVGAGLLLGIAVLQSPRPALFDIPVTRGYVLRVACTLVGVWSLIRLLPTLPTGVAAVPAVAAVWLGLRTYRSLPAAFALVSPEPGRAGKRSDAATADEGAARADGVDAPGVGGALPGVVRGGRLSLWITVWRVLYGRWMASGLWVLPFMALFGVLMSGWFDAKSASPNSNLAHIPIVAYMLVNYVFVASRNLHRLDTLPVSRDLLLRLLLLPPAVALLLGYAGGTIATRAGGHETNTIRYCLGDEGYSVRVPPAYLEIAWNGRPPLVTTPWGESHEAWSLELYRGSRVRLYSLYSTTGRSTPAWEALAISRAAGAVYGATIPDEEIRQRLLDPLFAGNSGETGTCFTLTESYPDLKARYRGHIAPIVLMLVGLWGYLLLIVYLRSFRAGVSFCTRKLAFVGLLIVAMCAYVGAVVLAMQEVVTIWAPNALLEILVRHLVQAAPWSESLLWLGCGLVLWLGYRRLLGVFERAELPVEAAKAAG